MCDKLAFKVIQWKSVTVNTINFRRELFDICIGHPSFGIYFKDQMSYHGRFGIDYSFRLNTSCKEEIEQLLKEVEKCRILL